jgi:hypothetical protein
MFDRSSRYFAVAEARHLDWDGTLIVHKQRRFLPQPRPQAGDRLVVVAAGERLDALAARIIGDPLQYWRIADLSNAMNPQDLAEAGRVLDVPGTGFRNAGSR